MPLQQQPSVALFIACYKRADFLAMVLESVLRQSRRPQEIVVCEDGRDPAMKAVVDDYQGSFANSLKHVTHDDRGNRKTLIVNKGISLSRSDYCIFIDGDCILRADFIEDHLSLATDRAFLTGRRIELSQKVTETLTPELIRSGYLDRWPIKLMVDALIGETHHIGRFFKTPVFLRKLLKRDVINDIRGCNFSVHRKYLNAVNGYSNDFSGAYGEDSDLEYRLKFLGLKMKGCKGAAIQFHLWHPTQVHDVTNQTKLRQVLNSQQARCTNGLNEASQIP